MWFLVLASLAGAAWSQELPHGVQATERATATLLVRAHIVGRVRLTDEVLQAATPGDVVRMTSPDEASLDEDGSRSEAPSSAAGPARSCLLSVWIERDGTRRTACLPVDERGGR